MHKGLDMPWKTVIFRLAIASAVGLMSSTAYVILSKSGNDWNTFGDELGYVTLMSASLLLVSSGLSIFLRMVSNRDALKWAAFASPVLLTLGLAFYAIESDARLMIEQGACDGSGELALFFASVHLSALLPATVFLIILDSVNSGL
jgi:heme/copper-type cytochrome/quinol oxidase subunit 3